MSVPTDPEVAQVFEEVSIVKPLHSRVVNSEPDARMCG